VKRIGALFGLDRLTGQILALITVALVTFHLIFSLLLRYTDADHRFPHAAVELLAGALRLVDDAEPEDRAARIREAQRLLPALVVTLDAAATDASAPDHSRAAEALRSRLWPDAAVTVSDTAEGLAASTPLHKGGYATALWKSGPAQKRPLSFFELPPGPPPGPPPRPLSNPLYPSAVFFVICGGIFLVWALRAVVGPLERLARAADALPQESFVVAPLAEEGPQEVRGLACALNRMQLRIHAMLETRSQFSAAISHDLRTLLTRVRLRLELLDDEATCAKVLSDLELMDHLLYRNLQRLRENRIATEYRLIDLDSVVQTVAHGFADAGHNVAYESAGRRMMVGSHHDLQRVLNNLIENAVKYAGGATIVLSEPAVDALQIDVMDEGPGMTALEKERLVEPFARGADPGREGFGLGLAIARQLLEEMGGALQLLDRAPRGLIARVTLSKGQIRPALDGRAA
jgi:signal transduction histidine kinase